MLTNFLPYLAVVKSQKSGPVTLTLIFNMVLEIVMQHFIKLSAAVHESSYRVHRRKRSAENNTAVAFTDCNNKPTASVTSLMAF